MKCKPSQGLIFQKEFYTISLRCIQEGKGEKYKNLKRVYSINFLKEPPWKDNNNYLSVFQILEKDKKFPLTEDLEIYIVELSKFVKDFDGLESDFELWFYLLKESSNLRVRDESIREKECLDQKSNNRTKNTIKD